MSHVPKARKYAIKILNVATERGSAKGTRKDEYLVLGEGTLYKCLERRTNVQGLEPCKNLTEETPVPNPQN